MGEVHTGLLQHSAAVSPEVAVGLVTLLRGVLVHSGQRPVAYVVSPDVLEGVDCHLAHAKDAKVRGVGTTISRVAITGGHVLQGSAYTQIRPGALGRRLPWSYYLARPGVVETVDKAEGAPLAEGFLDDRAGAGLLDLGAIGSRTMDRVQVSSALDHRPALRSARTRVRWVALSGDTPPAITFTVRRDARTIRLRGVADGDAVVAAAVATLCEDLALHDWLLTTLLSEVGRAQLGGGERMAALARLQPAIDHLLHLWMPAARVAADLAGLWESLDRRPGLSSQWEATVRRIRDQLALAAVATIGRR